MLSNQKDYFYLGSDATHPGRVFHGVLGAADNAGSQISPANLEAQFPSDKLVVPQAVTFHSTDGLEIHGQLFLPKNLKSG
ncbi:MAG TPA: hypothetical protein VMH89_11920, partial [Candidatus Acidoferrum sp.]|nr:hypothetical protein [Candidatus Acidoferrum sp.]